MAGNVGVYTSGPLWGRLVDARGPRLLFVSAFVFLLSGYSGIRGLFDSGLDDGARLSKLHLGLLIFCGFLTGLGSNAGVTSAINAPAKSFPDISRGTVVGIVISGFGLSAFVFSSISHLLFPGNTSDFLLILALGTSLPMILGFFFVRPIPLPSRSSVYAIESGRGGSEYERVSTSEPHSSFNKMNSSSTHLLAEPEDGGDEEGDQSSSNTLVPSTNGGVQLSPSTSYDVFRARNVTSDSQGSSLPEKTGRIHDISGRALWTAGDFWLLFCTNMLLSGTGLMYINNVGTISQALFAKGNPDYNEVEAAVWQAAQVSIVSVANFVGRIFIGITADFVKSHLRYPRSFCITIVSTLFITSQLVLLGADSVRNLWQASALLGFAYGSMFGLFPTVTIEWFGLTHFSENWGFVSLAPVVGGNLFSIWRLRRPGGDNGGHGGDGVGAPGRVGKDAARDVRVEALHVDGRAGKVGAREVGEEGFGFVRHDWRAAGGHGFGGGGRGAGGHAQVEDHEGGDKDVAEHGWRRAAKDRG
ncbi:hypothetical protein EWM64_g3108 [Hericium alpestre]|uniref:Nodulin-like domain-containing protein n=1 Tax=Hericium alpestre TaxID=135208 RepID=A0A4Z0A2E5_9AGAM|nr:hypothetical protein EWM64_g3108 [Hericium alpestre]